MKDEFGGSVIIKFVGLKSKKYFAGTEVGKKDKKGEGVNKNVEKIEDELYMNQDE